MDKKEIELEARLMAIEHLLTNLYVLHYASKGYTNELVASIQKMQLNQARQETFPNEDPAMSDYGAGEFEIALERLQILIFEKLKVLSSR